MVYYDLHLTVSKEILIVAGMTKNFFFSHKIRSLRLGSSGMKKWLKSTCFTILIVLRVIRRPLSTSYFIYVLSKNKVKSSLHEALSFYSRRGIFLGTSTHISQDKTEPEHSYLIYLRVSEHQVF